MFNNDKNMLCLKDSSETPCFFEMQDFLGLALAPYQHSSLLREEGQPDGYLQMEPCCFT